MELDDVRELIDFFFWGGGRTEEFRVRLVSFGFLQRGLGKGVCGVGSSPLFDLFG